MSGFTLRKRLGAGGDDSTLLEIPAANSIVVQKGDLIRVNTGGFGALATTGDLILGAVAGVVDKNGGRIDPDITTSDTYTMAGDNQTVAQKKIQYVPALQDYLFFADADGDLTQSNLFQYFGIDDENNPDAASVSPSDATVNTLRLIQLDPDGDGDASKGLWQIVESFFAQNGGGTVDTSGIEA